MEINKIATIYTDLPEKFGLPRQAGLAPHLAGRIVMEKEYRRQEAFRGLEGYSHIWLIWGFSECEGRWQPTVRPPRLGGNRRVGVFASRSPFRPNGLAISAVKLDRIDFDAADGPVLYVSGIDMASVTPVYDIKPYVPHADSIADAGGGFAAQVADDDLEVFAPKALLERLPDDKRAALCEILAQDPAPHYQDDPERVYSFGFAGYTVRFRRMENLLILTDIIHG